jgi:hypothetical protein
VMGNMVVVERVIEFLDSADGGVHENICETFPCGSGREAEPLKGILCS